MNLLFKYLVLIFDRLLLIEVLREIRNYNTLVFIFCCYDNFIMVVCKLAFSVSFEENNNTISTDYEYPCSQVQTTSDISVETSTQGLTTVESYTPTTEENPCIICVCNNITKNKTDAEIQESITKIQQALFVDSKTLTSHKIKKISAGDDRTSSAAIGGVAIAVLVIVVCFILFIDLLSVLAFCQSVFKARNRIKCN